MKSLIGRFSGAGFGGWHRVILPVAVATLVLLIPTGCEDDDDDGESIPSISPVSVKIDATNSHDLVFTARGGTPDYEWKVMNTSLGTLVSAQETAIYTSKPVAGQNIVTVTDARSNAVSATVTQF